MKIFHSKNLNRRNNMGRLAKNTKLYKNINKILFILEDHAECTNEALYEFKHSTELIDIMLYYLVKKSKNARETLNQLLARWETNNEKVTLK